MSKIKHRNVLLILAILFFLTGIIEILYYSIKNYNDNLKKYSTVLDKSHVFICDNPKYKSDFDNWLTDELGVESVPAYIIINNGYIIGAFDGSISESEFTSKLSMAISYNIPFMEIPEYSISNLNDERKNLKDIFNTDNTYILELVWIACEDCQYQDENYTQDIYNKYSTNHIYRYYIKSEKDKVLNVYK